MIRSRFLALTLLSPALAFAAASNVLRIDADDEGWGDVSRRGSLARMSNLDPLRQGGTELMRFSARATVGGTAGTPILGFVVSGDAKRLVVRGVRPALADFGVAGFLPDSLVELWQGQTLDPTNDNWLVAAAAAFAPVGAFALPAASKDAALVATFPATDRTAQISSAVVAGTSYSAQVSGKNHTTGTVLLGFCLPR